MTGLPIGMVPRGLTRVQAAVYCGCETPTAFSDWVRRGIVPGPMTGTNRWDRRAIDRALDRRSGLGAEVASSFEEWAAGHAG